MKAGPGPPVPRHLLVATSTTPVGRATVPAAALLAAHSAAHLGAAKGLAPWSKRVGIVGVILHKESGAV
jgi:hypothetical protein